VKIACDSPVLVTCERISLAERCERGGALLDYGFKFFVCKSQLSFIFS